MALAAVNQPKDIWDKISAVGTIVGTVFVTAGIAWATLRYSKKQASSDLRQRELDRMITRAKTVSEMIPYLSSGDPKQIEAALVSIAELGNEELARRFSVIYGSEGGFGALQRLATAPSPSPAADNPAEVSFTDLVGDLYQSVVQVHSGPVQATGFFIDTEHIITPNYAIGDGTDVHVIGKDQERIAVTVVYQDIATTSFLDGVEDGIAILRSTKSGRPLALSTTDEIAIGSDVYMLPFGQPAEAILYERAKIYATAADGRVIYMTGIGTLGDGGAPLLGRSGSVVGMKYAGRRDGERRADIALSVSRLRAAIAGVAGEFSRTRGKNV